MKWMVRITLFSLLISLFISLSTAQRVIRLSQDDAVKLGTQAYIYAYPLVTMDLTRKIMTNVEKPAGLKAPMGQFINTREYETSDSTTITIPNTDTLSSIAWLDLTKEPYILHVPDQTGRYYLMPILSAWMDVIGDPGTRTTGTQAQDFFIAGPDWKGEVPEDMIQIISPTNLVWLIGRLNCKGTAEDYDAVHALQDKYSLTPLSAYGKAYTPPVGTIDASVDMKTPIQTQINQMDAKTYFSYFARLLKDNPPSSSDAPMVVILAKLGIVPGKDFDINQLDAGAQAGLNQAVSKAQEKIKAHAADANMKRNGWLYSLQTGNYNTDYLQRAFVAAIGLGANMPVDSVYPITSTDSNGQSLTGINHYVLHFTPDKLPPVNGFWSLTLYNNLLYFVDNPLNRYTLSPRNALKYNADGSLDLYIQKDYPGPDRESNWLPTPGDGFILMLRLYWPKETVINGTWTPPPIQKT